MSEFKARQRLAVVFFLCILVCTVGFASAQSVDDESFPVPLTEEMEIAWDGGDFFLTPSDIDVPGTIKSGLYRSSFAFFVSTSPLQANDLVLSFDPNITPPLAFKDATCFDTGPDRQPIKSCFWGVETFEIQEEDLPTGERVTLTISRTGEHPLLPTDDGDSPVSNNDFDSSAAISEGSGRRDANNAGADKEISEPDHASDSGGASVWWTWMAPATGAITFDTRGSDFDTLLAVYTGDNLNRLAGVVSNDDVSEEEYQSVVRFRVQQGRMYHIAVDGYDGQTGTIVLNWQPVPVSETFVASVEISIPGPDGLTAVGRDLTWVAPAPEVDGFSKGWNRNRNDNGDLHGLQIYVDGVDIVVEQWLSGVRQATASYRDGKPFGAFSSYVDGELEGVQYDIEQDGWSFETYRDGTPHGPYGSYADGKPEGDFGTFADNELEGMLHTIDKQGWSFDAYRNGARHGPYATYNADGHKDGPFGIYTNGRKDPQEIHWADVKREPGIRNRPPLPMPENVPEEITFDPSRLDSLSLGWPNLFFWEPDGDTLEYFVSSEPPGMFDRLSDGSVIPANLSLSSSVSPGTSGRATVRACDPEGLCAEVVFKFLVQPEYIQRHSGDFSVEAPYCEDPLVKDHSPNTEIEICARDLDYEDGDKLTLELAAHEDQLPEYDTLLNDFHFLDLDFGPLSKSWSCKPVQVQGSIVNLQYDLEIYSEQQDWWDWTTGPLCEVGWSPDCFIGPRLWSHPGTEVNRGELIVRTRIDSGEAREWVMKGWGTGRSEGTIRIRTVGLEPEDHHCVGDTGTVKFRITDACDDGQAIHARLFQEMNPDESSGGSWVAQWPKTQGHYYVTQSYDVESFVRVPCPSGQRVCYGAESADGRRSWGVGLDGTEGCQACCQNCPNSGDADFSISPFTCASSVRPCDERPPSHHSLGGDGGEFGFTCRDDLAAECYEMNFDDEIEMNIVREEWETSFDRLSADFGESRSRFECISAPSQCKTSGNAHVCRTQLGPTQVRTTYRYWYDFVNDGDAKAIRDCEEDNGTYLGKQ